MLKRHHEFVIERFTFMRHFARVTIDQQHFGAIKALPYVIRTTEFSNYPTIDVEIDQRYNVDAAFVQLKVDLTRIVASTASNPQEITEAGGESKGTDDAT